VTTVLDKTADTATGRPPRPEKVAIVAEIRRRLESSQATVVTEYRGLDVTGLATLRSRLRPAGVRYKVYKNTLVRIAVKEAGLDDLLPFLEGPVAIAFVEGDAVLAAKALSDFAGENDKLVLKGGLLGSKVLTEADVKALAKIESRDVLLAKLAGAFQAPLAKAAGLFAALPRNTAYGIKALIDQRIAAGEAPPPAAADAADEDAVTTSEAPAADDAAVTMADPLAKADATEPEAPEPEAPAPEAEAPEAEPQPEAAAPEAASDAEPEA
jgi:large subunit ribosomal protein L10